MNWLENLKLAAGALWANRLRSVLTMIGLVIGIGAVILVVALGVGAQRFVSDQFAGLGTNVIGIFNAGPRTRGRQPLTLADIEAVRTQASSVRRVAPIAVGQGKINWGDHKSQGQLQGVPFNISQIIRINFSQGRFFTPAEIDNRKRVVILGELLSRKLFGYENPVGKTVMINDNQMTVVGVTKRSFFGSWIDLDRGMLVPLSVALESLVASDSPFGKKVDGFIVESKPGVSSAEMTFEVRNLLRLRHNVTDREDFLIANAQDVVNLFNGVALGVTVVLGLTAAISLVVSGIGIMNIMLVSVTERTREIGLRKALGATEEVILTQFVIEAVLLSLVGGVIGMAWGIAAALGIANISPLKPEVTTWSILLAVVVSAGTGLFFGVFPARRAARLDPIVALRTE
ncbi:ABC transporter permease [Gloeobacter kilaueensis]|uniref:Macrolide transporter ATP-binding /permease protein n=1 Tax=Gloeobacter kilaueensis (strain ATCC BAA-2537 / CCAP 1431/1 / ULC 316 / JS1) TaxID=1183438 RepID=U5QQJ5_GLOK1|nr:ABC transporter permease [Gloeobacter kilaueensis]AGY59955.1 macrolide transporter ATP-binding /permease protein [Gloeobacter kilaueensis JS1]